MALQGDAIGYMATLQREIGVTVDLIPGPQTLAACPTLQEGDSGEVVRSLQFFVGAPRDGQFGPATKRAVVAFQGCKNISQDGIVGHATWREILKPFAADYGISL